MAKPRSISTLRKHLWGLTSKYVRLKSADSGGYAACVTCGAVKRWQDQQAGHWVPKAQGNATAWDLRNIHTQCFRCNVNLGGNGPEYSAYMLKRYGRKECDEIRRLSKTTRKITRVEYEEMIEQMAEKLADLITRRSCDIPRIDIASK